MKNLVSILIAASLFLLTATSVHAESTAKDFIQTVEMLVGTGSNAVAVPLDIRSGETHIYYKKTAGQITFYKDPEGRFPINVTYTENPGEGVVGTVNDIANEEIKFSITANTTSFMAIYKSVVALEQSLRFKDEDANNLANYKVSFEIISRTANNSNYCVVSSTKRSFSEMGANSIFDIEVDPTDCPLGHQLALEQISELVVNFNARLYFDCSQCETDYGRLQNGINWEKLNSELQILRRDDQGGGSDNDLEYYFRIPKPSLPSIPNFDFSQPDSYKIIKDPIIYENICELSASRNTVTLEKFVYAPEHLIKFTLDGNPIHLTRDFVIRSGSPGSLEVLNDVASGQYYIAPAGLQSINKLTSDFLCVGTELSIDALYFNRPILRGDLAECRGVSTVLVQGDSIKFLDLLEGVHIISFAYKIGSSAADQLFCSAQLTIGADGSSTISNTITGTGQANATFTYAQTEELCTSLPSEDSCTDDDGADCKANRAKATEDCNLCAHPQDTNEKPGIWTAVGCLSTDPSLLISHLFTILSGIMGGFLLICIIWNGFQVMTSAGNPEALKKAQESITSCVIGFIVLLFAVLIIRIIGVDILQLPWFGPAV
ncbi:hypothetical protein COU89_00410 [Candidatus Roizmanbacteria bacterium CG10_big_fil_rev_8_21_14_0_10_45_7]|uniref:Uncharacterized protein n=1 Tax=Candidatus Roizmanbacteria bacterium CG10_big_fil_rev_8_21_14_0_10_45_7 TaxID=1974854 RepID=A0A2M8KVK4_9BACT|nr:MAG: hypothetical protein COU89_00410 [Candidatus Roizmanbacteria bacterium CG10_big_fil_rev_8_21_14_0_10_45_7]